MTILQFKRSESLPAQKTSKWFLVKKRVGALLPYVGFGLAAAGIGVLAGLRTLLFMIVLWLKPVVTGIASFMCGICFVLGGIFYMIPRVSGYSLSLLLASFAFFLITFAYETIVHKLAPDGTVRMY